MSIAEAQLDHAWKLFQAKDYARAIEAYSAIIAADANSHEAYSERARCHRRVGGFDQAIGDLSHAIELSPKNAGYRFTRGRYLFEMDRLREACIDFSSVLDLEKRMDDQSLSQSAIFFRAESNYKMQYFDAALSDCSKIREGFNLHLSGRMRTREQIIHDAEAGLNGSD